MFSRIVSVFSIALLFLASPLSAQPVEQKQVLQVDSFEVPFSKYDEKRNSLPQYKRKNEAASVVLDALGRYDIEARDQPLSGNDMSSVPMSVGIGRNIETTRDQKLFGQLLDWELMEDGARLSAVSFTSPGAVGNRLILDVAGIDPRTTLVFRDANDAVVHQVTGLDVLDTFSALGHDEKQERLFAGPYIEGEVTTLEVVLPAGVKIQTLKISVPRLSHVFVSPYDAEASIRVGESASCQVDVSCKPEWDDVSRSVALMVFSDMATGGSYICTGTLMNDSAGSRTPYFLTANHCISSQSVASTLQTLWFYKSSSCLSGDASPSSQARHGGASLVFTKAETDTTLLKLNDQVPAGVTYQGWSARLPSLPMIVGGVHHPSGDVQKVSNGQVTDFSDCSLPSSNGSFYCDPSSAYFANHIKVNWSSGVTEGGSSGSGLFQVIGNKRYLIGQLRGGSSSCQNPANPDYYGRFDVAFNAGISDWLVPEPADVPKSPIYRFYNTATGTHFFTADESERDFVIGTYPSFIYEGVAFYAFKGLVADFSSVFRFFNTTTGAHFYTINAAERDNVILTP